MAAALLLVSVVAVAAPAKGAAPPGRKGAAVWRSAPPTDTLRDLRGALAPGWILRDLSGDSVVDALDVRIVVPDRAAPGDPIAGDGGVAQTVAAANLAARFGYETSASELGLVVREGALGAVTGPVVLVGDRVGLLGASGTTREEARRGMAPGEGALLFLPAGPTLPSGGVAVVGYDATGLLEAAEYMAGRYPSVWGMDGDEWRDVTDALGAFAQARGAADGAVVLERVAVDADRPGIARARATVRVDDPAAFDALVQALSDEGAAESDDPEGGDDPEAEEPGAEEAEADEPPGLESLRFRHLHRLDVHLLGPDSERTIPVRPEEPWETGAGQAWRAGSDATFSLADVYQVDGLFRDSNRDLVPDEIAGYLSVSPTTSPERVGDLATRIGLEAAGLRVPLAVVASQTDAPEEAGFPVVVGGDHYQLGRLLAEDELPGWSSAPGEGTVRFVDGAFNGRNGMVVAGGDRAGTDAALDWLSTRAPYLREHGKGRYRLADAQAAARRVLQTRKAPGQAALALYKLDSWMERLLEHGSMAGPPLPAVIGDSASVTLLAGGDRAGRSGGATEASSRSVERVEVEMAVEEAEPGLDGVARSLVTERFPDAEVDVRTFSTGFGVGDTVYASTFDVPWEVDEVRTALGAEVYPNVERGGDASVHVRVSEPPEIRAELEEEIRSELAARGVATMDVTVLNAYKQGYSWLYDDVLPRLERLDFGEVAGIRIEYHTLEDSDEVRWQTVAADTRWLQELYPIDAVLARDLGIEVDDVTFHAVQRPDTVYRVVVTDPAGVTLLEDTFQPRYVVRPFFDLFPEYEQVRVTTGWLTATVGDRTVVDRRVVTDPEAFWDVLQTDVYGSIIEYVMDIQDGDPSSGSPPYFDEFTVRLRLSEPDHRIGVDEEVISSLEALHEDIYFETLTLFDLIGSRYGVGGLSYPGRVLPYMDPTGAGRPGEATVTVTGKERGVAELVVRAHPEEGPVEFRRYDLGSLPAGDPSLVGVTVAADPDEPGKPGPAGSAGEIRELLFAVEVADSVDRYDEYRGRSSEAGIDRGYLSVTFMEGVLGQLRRLHDAGLYGEALSWDAVGRTSLLFTVEDDSTFSRIVTIPRSSSPASTRNPVLVADGWSYGGEPLVQWRTPIPPAESDSVLAKLNTFPGVDAYYITHSFLGQPVWAADFLPEGAGLDRGIVSQAKLNALKPTLFISGRQHANEVSSTSHILRLGELLATDSTYRSYLDDVNVVLHPITNPDGARLAVEMQETNPDHMLHAGYLGALGVDATSGERSDDPIYPESQARRRIRDAWLPDAYVNMHGYPSHEWVQYFASYSAWVRSRRGGQRDWWSPRGWFIPGFRWVDDEEQPEYTEAQFAMLDSVAASIRGNEEVASMNDRLYARYRKYGTQDRDDFREYFRDGILVYLSIDGAGSIGNGSTSTRITYFSTTTEAPDETARGDWLELVASAGLAHSSALLRYLANGTYEIEREADAFDGVVTRKVYRVRPVLPPDGPDSGREDPGDLAPPLSPQRGPPPF